MLEGEEGFLPGVWRLRQPWRRWMRGLGTEWQMPPRAITRSTRRTDYIQPMIRGARADREAA